MTDGQRLVGAVNAVERGPEIERPRAERIVRAARHMARQIGTAQQHLGRRRPVRPFGLAADPLDARPFEAWTPYADAVAQRLSVWLDQEQEPVRRVHDKGSCRLGS